MTPTILIPHPEIAIFVIQQAHHAPAFVAGLLVGIVFTTLVVSKKFN